ncbi:MAG: nucleotide exchange factor GrpE [Burkholderiales bacterium]
MQQEYQNEKELSENKQQQTNSTMENTTVNDIVEELEELSAKEKDDIMLLEEKVAELKDLYLRSQADVQNVQRRSNEEIKKARDYAITSFAKDIILVKDHLEMALNDQSGNFEALKMGVDLTLKQLVQIFERHLIKEIDPKAQDKLDPNLHQAISTVEVEDQEPNTIAMVMQKGYLINDRVLRPAMVTVAK